MLDSMRLRQFRSFADTEDVSFRRLNILIGPNSAGKSAFLSAIELFLRSLEGFSAAPLSFDELPAFASFDSVLRRHWTPKKPRSSEILLDFSWQQMGETIRFHFACQGRSDDNTTYVARETFVAGDGSSVSLVATDSAAGGLGYTASVDGKKLQEASLHFRGPIPILLDPGWKHATPYMYRRMPHVEVVRPYRPVPRSFYVLDDPGLSVDDRNLISFLIELWRSKEAQTVEVRERVVENLKTLGLVSHFAIKHLGHATGPKVVRIEVAPTVRRQSVTIADVGFGLSQALPLAASEARLRNGCLIAYQPEVHLHPYAQSRLADVFCESVLRGNQIFVETHSTDLILRLQERVAAGFVPADTVRVFCLSNEHGISRVTPIDLGSGGSPQIAWPKGFLDTSLQLARDLATRRHPGRK